MRALRIRVLWALAGSMLLCAQALAAELTARVDREQVALGDTFVLQVQLDDRQVQGNLDLSSLEPLFEVHNQSTRRSQNFVNGRQSSSTLWRVELSAKREGRMVIPALSVGGLSSDPIELQVTPASAAQQESADARFELEADKQQLRLKEQLIVTQRLYFAKPVSQLQMPALEIDNATVEKLDDNEFQTTRGGRRFGVYEVRWAVFPKALGPLQLPVQDIRFVLGGRRNFFGLEGGQAMRLSNAEQTLEVIDIPDDFSADDWLIANHLALSEQWSQAPEQITLGDSLTRTLQLNVLGASPEQVPTLEMPAIDGANLYPEPAQKENRLDPKGLISQRRRSIAIVPNQVGELVLPEIRLRWWDALQQVTRTAHLPERRIQVRPGAQQAPLQATPAPAIAVSEATLAAANPEATAFNTGLVWSNLLLALLSMIFAGLWWRERRRPSAPIATEANAAPDPKALFEAVVMACRLDDGLRAHQAIVQWAEHSHRQGYLPREGLAGLAQVANPELKQLLQQLEAHLYAREPSSAPNLPLLLTALEKLRAQWPKAPARAAKPNLAPLYPKSA